MCRSSALAQLVEQLTVNQRVAGSSPAGGAIFSSNQRVTEGPESIPKIDQRRVVSRKVDIPSRALYLDVILVMHGHIPRSRQGVHCRE